MSKKKEATAHQETKVHIYLDDGRVFSYAVDNEEKGREHSFAIVSTGYRHTPKPNENGETYLEHYPPHRILKVKITGIVTTKYHDEVSGT